MCAQSGHANEVESLTQTDSASTTKSSLNRLGISRGLYISCCADNGNVINGGEEGALQCIESLVEDSCWGACDPCITVSTGSPMGAIASSIKRDRAKVVRRASRIFL